MKRFVVIYRVPVEVAKRWREETPEEEKRKQDEKIGAEMTAWFEKRKAAIVDNGNPLGKNTRMSSVGARSETNDLNFYNVVQAESVEQVVEMHKDNPHMRIPEAYLDIMEVPHMGM